VHCLACTYRVRALSGGDDVTGRQPGCGRDFATLEHGNRGLKRGGEWAWLFLSDRRPLQAWPKKARRVGVAIANANINVNIKRRVD